MIYQEHANLVQWFLFQTMAFMCGVCGALLKSGDSLRQHKMMHKNTDKYNCATCGKVSFSKANAKMHEASHKLQKTLTCINCGKKFGSQGYLNRDIRKEMGLGKTFKCDMCD